MARIVDQERSSLGSRSLPPLDRSGSVHAERLKQQGRLFPLSIFEMLTSTRRRRVSGFFVALTQRTHSQRAIGVISLHRPWIFCGAAARAVARSCGTLGSGQSLVTTMSSVSSVTRADAGCPLQGVIDSHPVAEISVWFEHRLEVDAIDRPLHGHLPARGQVLARCLRQPQYSRCVDRGQRGVERNGRFLCALSHRRLSPFRSGRGAPMGTPSSRLVTVDTLQRASAIASECAGDTSRWRATASSASRPAA